MAPSELEDLLMTHTSVADAGVVGVPNDYAGELPRAYVVLRPGASTTPEELINYVAGEQRPAAHANIFWPHSLMVNSQMKSIDIECM